MSSQGTGLKNAILFNGAASYIAQEAAMLDLLLGNIEGVEGVGLNIRQGNTFIGGLSSGALMTFIVNAAFCNHKPPTIPIPPEGSLWEYYKNLLWDMETEDVYTGTEIPFNTNPLKNFITDRCDEAGYHTLSDLPFESAILTVAKERLTSKTCWLTNILDIANQLPTGGDVYANIRNHQLNLELVSSLMCSTAIPGTFPEQQLYYNRNQTINENSGEPAKFCDGGSFGVFKRFRQFFNKYLEQFEKFDKIYLISPNFASQAEDAYKLIKAPDLKSATEMLDAQFIIDQFTNEFIKALYKYNSDGHLANEIYYCKPGFDLEVPDNQFDPLSFGEEEDQYDVTKNWGQSNPNDIAININDIEDSRQFDAEKGTKKDYITTS